MTEVDRFALSGAAAALASVVVMGASVPVLALLTGYPFATAQVARYVLAVLLLLLIARAQPALPSSRALVRLGVLSVTGVIAYNAFLINAVATTDPGTVGVIIGALPVLMALVVPIAAGRRPLVPVVACAIVASLGAALVQQGDGEVTAVGLACAVAALACEVAFILIIRDLMETMGAVDLAFWTCLLSVPQLVVGAVLFEGASLWQAPTASEAMAIVFLSVGGSVIALILWSIGVARLGSERFGVFTAAAPVSALLVSAWLGEATLTGLRLVGCMLVAATVVAVARLSPPSLVTA